MWVILTALTKPSLLGFVVKLVYWLTVILMAVFWLGSLFTDIGTIAVATFILAVMLVPYFIYSRLKARYSD